MEDSIEKILIAKAKQNNMSAFEKLVLMHEKSVYNVAYRMFNNEEDAKDMSQEIFIKVFKNIGKYDEKSKLSTWIHTIAVNTCIDEIRKRKGKDVVSMEEEVETESGEMVKQFASSELTPEEILISRENAEEIKSAITELSQQHKTFIILRDLEGLSYDEIAQITGNTLGTVKSGISRARISLKNIIIRKRELLGQSSRLRGIDGKEGAK